MVEFVALWLARAARYYRASAAAPICQRPATKLGLERALLVVAGSPPPPPPPLGRSAQSSSSSSSRPSGRDPRARPRGAIVVKSAKSCQMEAEAEGGQSLSCSLGGGGGQRIGARSAQLCSGGGGGEKSNKKNFARKLLSFGFSSKQLTGGAELANCGRHSANCLSRAEALLLWKKSAEQQSARRRTLMDARSLARPLI